MESYRLVSKKYFCYGCNQTSKKMVQPEDLAQNGLICDSCGSGFCEVIDGDNENEFAQQSKDQKVSNSTSMIDQLHQISEEQMNVPPKVTNLREDIRNTNTRSD